MVVPPRNHGALCEAWLKMIEMGSAKRRGLGEKARKRIENHFSIQMIVKKYEQLYEEQIRCHLCIVENFVSIAQL